MDYESILRETWSNIDYQDGGSLMLDLGNHPIEWHVQYLGKNRKALVIISKYNIKDIESSKCITAESFYRSDDTYAISMQLTDDSQEDVFISMCSDLIRYSSTGLSEKEAIRFVSIRYKQWRRLMEKKNRPLLSIQDQKGLIGELLFLQKNINEGMQPKRALDGWVGPDGADQDFVYSGTWHEIKSTGIASPSVSISSVEQLGNSEDTGELIVMRIDQCAPEDKGAMSINDVVNRVASVIASDPDAIDLLFDKLANVGYMLLPEYDEIKFKHDRMEVFDVNSSFPRITRSFIQSEIINAEYSISLSSIDKWRKE